MAVQREALELFVEDVAEALLGVGLGVLLDVGASAGIALRLLRRRLPANESRTASPDVTLQQAMKALSKGDATGLLLVLISVCIEAGRQAGHDEGAVLR